jgi:hypothetical protein
MFTQHPPFTKAEPSDPFYRLLCANRADLFWKAHSKNKPNGLDFFSEDFRNLITSMLQYDPAHRLSMAEVKAHPWYVNGPVVTLEEIQQEFANRKQSIDAQAEVQRQQKEAEKAQRAGGLAQRRAYRGAHRGDGDDEEEEKIEKRNIEEYIRVVNKNTEIFSTEDPDVLLGTIVDFADKQGYKYQVAKDKYKVKLEILLGEETVDMTIKISKVDANKHCIEINRTGGDQLVFFEQFKQMKEYFGDLIDATY